MGRVVSNQIGRHRRDFHFRHSNLTRGFFADEIGVVDRREQATNNASDGRWGNDVDLGTRMTPDKHSGKMLHQRLCHVFECHGIIIDTRSTSRVIVQLDRFSQQGTHRFHPVELIESPEKRKHEVGIMDPIRISII